MKDKRYHGRRHQRRHLRDALVLLQEMPRRIKLLRMFVKFVRMEAHEIEETVAEKEDLYDERTAGRLDNLANKVLAAARERRFGVFGRRRRDR